MGLKEVYWITYPWTRGNAYHNGPLDHSLNFSKLETRLDVHFSEPHLSPLLCHLLYNLIIIRSLICSYKFDVIGADKRSYFNQIVSSTSLVVWYSILDIFWIQKVTANDTSVLEMKHLLLHTAYHDSDL